MTTVLDLFCGAGGMSLGFQNAGYEVVAGVDYNEAAIETYRSNYDHKAIHEDLTQLTPKQFAIKYDIWPEDVDVVAGGPPCQDFSLANINREVDSERANLVFVFAEYVDFYQPTAFVMENVKGITSAKGGEVLENLLSDLRDSGYSVEAKTLNAADYGVPQIRERLFVQGHFDGKVQWPEPTHTPKEEPNTQKKVEEVVV